MATKRKTSSTGTKKEPKYPLWKYLELEPVSIDKYQRAYVEVVFRGILNTKDEWAIELKPYLEGNK